MKINHIELQSYRNYTNQSVDFCSGLNALIGKNAQGKTNLVEAINFCSIGKSFRTSKDKELIQFGQEKARIYLELEKTSGKSNIEVIISNSQKKIVRINSYSILRMGELMGELNCILFSPENLKIIKEGPQDRRRFIDIDLSQLSKVYFYNLLKYEKILAQRNKLLKSSIDKVSARSAIDVWNEQLSRVGAKIIYERQKFLESLAEIAMDIHSRLTNGTELLVIAYDGITGTSPDDIYREFYDKLTKSIDKDIDLGYTTVGPHRDDIKIICNSIDARTYASQGQQRTVALSLKLAELEYFKVEKGEYPVLILDDVLSELDETRAKLLLENTTHIQTILTGTHFSFTSLPHALFNVENGIVTKK